MTNMSCYCLGLVCFLSFDQFSQFGFHSAFSKVICVSFICVSFKIHLVYVIVHMLTYFYFIACETPLESLWILLQLVAFSRGAVKAQNIFFESQTPSKLAYRLNKRRELLEINLQVGKPAASVLESKFCRFEKLYTSCIHPLYTDIQFEMCTGGPIQNLG